MQMVPGEERAPPPQGSGTDTPTSVKTDLASCSSSRERTLQIVLGVLSGAELVRSSPRN